MSALRLLRSRLEELDRVVVAFSGGADSALLAYVANDVLGPQRATAVTAVSPSLAPEEAAECERLAASWGLDWRPLATAEMADDRYAVNDSNRCYFCKSALMDVVSPLAEELGAVVVLGVNVDDLADRHRPGQQAAVERGAVFPLADAGLTKADVRAVSKELGLETWDKPAAACLSSRLPYGTRVTITTLGAVARAESALRALGFAALRVRHYDDTARIEVPLDDVARIVELRRQVVDGVRAAGYRYVTLDLEGLRSGNLNGALQ